MNYETKLTAIPIKDAINKGLAKLSPEPCPYDWSATIVQQGNKTYYVYTSPDCPQIIGEKPPFL